MAGWASTRSRKRSFTTKPIFALGLPSQDELETRAVALVDDAHRIARERGRNVLSIMKELVADLKKK